MNLNIIWDVILEKEIFFITVNIPDKGINELSYRKYSDETFKGIVITPTLHPKTHRKNIMNNPLGMLWTSLHLSWVLIYDL